MKSHLSFRRLRGLAAAVFGLTAVSLSLAARPNVLFIMSDDLNNDLGCYGHPMVKSPNIDRLAARGVRFDRAYTQNAVCNASRSSMLSGRRPKATRVHSNGGDFRTALPGIVTLPQSFRQSGYRVVRIGKIFHYSVPLEIGTDGHDDAPSWDQTINPRGRDVDDEDRIFTLAPQLAGAARFGGFLSWLAAEGRDEDHTDGKIALAAIAQLQELKTRDQPFFLAIGFFRPHTPFVAPRSYFELYPREKIPLPVVPKDLESRFLPAALCARQPEQDAMTDVQRREAIQAYYAATTFMDAQIGKVLNALDELGLADNTIVVFLSDHGYHLGEKSLWQKRTLFEQAARVPLIIADPRLKTPGGVSARTVELVDLYPTLTDLCGVQSDPDGAGVSLRPLLVDPDAPWSRPAFTEMVRFAYRGQSVRTERWRFSVWNGGRQGIELYDHASDPDEMNNLAGDPQYASVLGELGKLAQRHAP